MSGLDVCPVVAVVIAKPFAAYRSPEVDSAWRSVAARHEARIAQNMGVGVCELVPQIVTRSRQPNFDIVEEGTHASFVLKFLRDNGNGFSYEQTPYRLGLSKGSWNSAFSQLKKRGFIRAIGLCKAGNPTLWTLTAKGRAMVATYGAQK